VILPGDGDGIELRPWRTAQSSLAGSSMALAQAVADGLAQSFPTSPILVRAGEMSVLEPVLCPAIMLESAPAARPTAESMNIRGYTTYEYTQTVARAIEDLLRKAKA
jgi:uncharacterized phosphosugar-binding protein